MSTTDPIYDVSFVPRSRLPHLPTDADPAGNLGPQVPSPFGTGIVSTVKVGITVLSMLDEPVEAIACYVPHGTLGAVPVVRANVDDEPRRSPSHEEAKDAVGFGWIDPTGYDDLVSVGSWVVDTEMLGLPRKASAVLHLRCSESKVDILVGGHVAERLGNAGGWNPYNIALYEPGVLHANDTVYDDFFQRHVDNGNGTSDDREGHSDTAPVHYLARTPQGRTDWWWRILVFLGPRPIKKMWDEPPASTDAAMAAHGNLEVEDGIQRLLAILRSSTPVEDQWPAMDAALADYDPVARMIIQIGYVMRVSGLVTAAPPVEAVTN